MSVPDEMIRAMKEAIDHMKKLNAEELDQIANDPNNEYVFTELQEITNDMEFIDDFKPSKHKK